MASAYQAAISAQRRPGLVHRDGGLDRSELVRLGTLAASSHNTQPWRFRLGARTIAIAPDLSRRCPVVDPDDSHLFKSLGCAAENIVQGAPAQAHRAHPTFDPATGRIEIALEPSAAAREGPLFAAIPTRQCTRLPYDGRAIPPAARAALEAAGSGTLVQTILIEDEARRRAIADLIRAGNEMQLGDPAFRKELAAWLRFNDSAALRTGDGLASRAAGHPPIPDWLARLIIGFVLSPRSQARRDALMLASTAMLAAIVAAENTPRAWVEAGRACQRLALQAAALDLRTAFVNQPIEVPSLRGELHRLLGLGDGQAMLLLRVGSGPLAPYSLRRPVATVIEAN
ncbi:MAG: nitroreductase family protein [Alphaproteobacteria bacterium]|nr:nitroreductase family protein [Alphaproteobacteria bacterium]